MKICSKIIFTILTLIIPAVISDWSQVGNDIDGELSDDFSGYSTALSSDGSTVVVGAYYNDGNGLNSGHVRVYRNVNDNWSQIGSDIDGEVAQDNFGWSVSISADGNTVAVGALYNDGGGALSGHVQIFAYIDNAWNQVGSDIDGEAAYDNAGFSVSISADGNIVALGARYADGNAIDAGHVRVFQNVDNEWSQVGSDIDGEADHDNAGSSVSLNGAGNVVAVGAIYNDANTFEAGHVRVYRYLDGDWSKIGDDIDGEAARDNFGFSVSLSSEGDIVAVGAINNDDNGDNSGHVRVYRNINDNWTQIGSDISGEAAFDRSGSAVSLSNDGNIVAIGAKYNDGNGINSGQARIFQNINDEWVQLGNDIDGEALDDFFGRSISISGDGNIVAIGADGNDGNGSGSGHVRVFRLVSYEVSSKPTHAPTLWPSTASSNFPSIENSNVPSLKPSYPPTVAVSGKPTVELSSHPTFEPSFMPSLLRSSVPSIGLSQHPTRKPSASSSTLPSSSPSVFASSYPTNKPSLSPSKLTSSSPTFMSSISPTNIPSYLPSVLSSSPSVQSSQEPSSSPSNLSSWAPSISLTLQPKVTSAPSNNLNLSNTPSISSSMHPSIKAFQYPTVVPSKFISIQPSVQPSRKQSHTPSQLPSRIPSIAGSEQPTKLPSLHPSIMSLVAPSVVTYHPTMIEPSLLPSSVSSLSAAPSDIMGPTTLDSSFSESPTFSARNFPSTSPSIAQYFSPSSYPTTVLPVATIITLESIHDSAENNETLFVDSLKSFDVEYLAYLENDTSDLSNYPYGGFDKESYSPFVIDSVQSLPIGTCLQLSEGNTCYTVNSNVTVIHHPILFAEDSIALILADSSHSYLNKRQETRFNEKVPTTVSAIITITLVGVENSREMDKEEINIFETSLQQFLNNNLLSADDDNPSILVENVLLSSQSIVENLMETNENERKIEEAEDNTLTVVVTVAGVYLPPPTIIFDEILVETLDEEGDDDFIEILNANADSAEETYFNPVSSAISSLMEDDDNEDSSGSLFSIIFGLVGGFVGLVAISSFTAYMRKSFRRFRNAQREENLRQDVLKSFQLKNRATGSLFNDSV